MVSILGIKSMREYLAKNRGGEADLVQVLISSNLMRGWRE